MIGVTELHMQFIFGAADQYQVTSILPYVKAEIICAVSCGPKPEDLLPLIQQMRGISELAEATKICAKELLKVWHIVKNSDGWKDLAGDPDLLGLTETLMEAAAECHKTCNIL
ncbi:hypothetical protein HK104_006016 [Borealophlyctis nickersoniae]|nr:hypothetical protein HK104_006016 [Borealophlyctis nickersoniae]